MGRFSPSCLHVGGWVGLCPTYNLCDNRHVLNDKSMGKKDTKKRKMMSKQLKDEVMASVDEKNTEEYVPLRGRGL
jgi:hypothetical protein